MMEIAHLRQWIGRTEETFDRISRAQVAALFLHRVAAGEIALPPKN